jgi:hypothetical protein
MHRQLREVTMQYVCLVYLEQKTFDAMTPEEERAMQRANRDYDDSLKESGHLIDARPLQPTRTATTIRVRDGRMSKTDGPFAETKEHLGGFVLIEAADLNEAIRVAAASPMARYGSIEVRPVMELSRD